MDRLGVAATTFYDSRRPSVLHRVANNTRGLELFEYTPVLKYNRASRTEP